MISLIVVPVEANDQDQWQSLYRGYADFYQVPMTDEILDTVWHWIHDDANPFYCLVAKDSSGKLMGGGPLGFMHFRAMPSPLRGTTVGFLDDLFVAPEARGQGVVESLFAGLRTQGNELGWPLVRWITADNNYRARTVYDQCSTKTHWQTYQMDLP